MLCIALCFGIFGVSWDEMGHTHSSTPSAQDHCYSLYLYYHSQSFEAHCQSVYQLVMCRSQSLSFYIKREIIVLAGNFQQKWQAIISDAPYKYYGLSEMTCMACNFPAS